MPPVLEGHFHLLCSGLGEKNQERKRESNTSDPRCSSDPAGHRDGLRLSTCISSPELKSEPSPALPRVPGRQALLYSAAPGCKGARGCSVRMCVLLPLPERQLRTQGADGPLSVIRSERSLQPSSCRFWKMTFLSFTQRPWMQK